MLRILLFLLCLPAYGQISCFPSCGPTSGPGSGTVTAVSASALSPLFTTSVATATTTPAISFSAATAAANTIFGGPVSGGPAAGTFQTAPTISAANMTSFPTFNQNTTGTAGGLAAPYVDWNAVSGGAEILNKPTIPSAPIHQYGGQIGSPSGAVLTTGADPVYFTIPQACTVIAWDIKADTGTATVKFWKVANGTALPTSGNSINTSGVAISTGTAVHSTTLSDFTSTAVTALDIGAVTITAVSGAHMVQASLECQ